MSTTEGPKFEWRICWSASSNITFKGQTDWEPWDDDEETVDEVESALCVGSRSSIVDDAFCNSSGVEYYPEVREIGHAGEDGPR